MHVILRLMTRQCVEAILLSATPDRLRVVMRSHADTLDLHRVDGHWFSDQGSPVEIESIMTDGPSTVARIWHEARPRTGTAAC